MVVGLSMQIANRTVLVSGASSGLGAACARRLLKLGANVVGLDRSPPGAWLSPNEAAQGSSDRYWHGQADVTDEASVQRVVAQHTQSVTYRRNDGCNENNSRYVRGQRQI